MVYGLSFATLYAYQYAFDPLMHHNTLLPKIILILLLAVIAAGAICLGLFYHHDNKPTQNKQSDITIYSKPDSKDEHYFVTKPQKELVGFYKQGQWIKVGDLENGQSGWITQQDFQAIQFDKKSILFNFIVDQTASSTTQQLDQYEKQALSLQQQLNRELQVMPDQKAILKMQQSYNTQLLLIKKMINNLKQDLSRFQKNH